MTATLSAAELRARRLAMGLSQRRLAAELGVTATTVARWERGERAISNAVLVQLALDQLTTAAALERHDMLPEPPVPLIGRDRDLAEITALLADRRIRLLTLTGPGGSGKTSLALCALGSMARARCDGARLVSLADLPARATARALSTAVAAALGLREVTGEPFSETVARALRRSDVLLLLDNCEHVAPAVADLSSLLVARCPKITVVATSRELLRVRAERGFAVTPLRVPDLARLPPPATLLRVPSVMLFVSRWSAAHPGFRLTSADAPAVAAICVRLDGLPLAIELAAAHGQPPSPAALLRRLDSPGHDAGPGLRDIPDRHRSLRAMLDWSYRLLDEQSQAFFRRMGVFTGGFDPQSAAEVVLAGTDDAGRLVATIDLLIDAHLLTSSAAPDGGQRLLLLETVRAFARDRLAEAGELPDTARRHASWLVRWAEAGASKFENESQLDWLDDLEAELGNLQAALAWARSEHGDAYLGLRLAAAIRRYWDMRGLPTEAQEQLGTLLAAAPQPSAARLNALIELAGLATRREDLAALERHAGEAAQIAADLGDLRSVANASELLTYAAFLRGDPARARILAAESLDQAIEADHPVAIAHAWMAQGVAAFAAGDLAAAAAPLTRALDQARARGDRWFVGECGSVLAHVHLEQGSYQAARAAQAESLAARVALKNRPGIALNLKVIGIADAATASTARAALLLGGAAAIEETTGETWNVHWLAAYKQAVATVTESLGPARCAELWNAGRTMAEAAVIRIALLALPVALPSAAEASSARSGPNALSYRETQVSELIAEGLTNSQIARRLGIARRTAAAHAEHIMTKLGVHSRAQVAAWVGSNRASPG